MRVRIITIWDLLIVIQGYDGSQTHGKTFRVIPGNHLLVHVQEQFSLPILQTPYIRVIRIPDATTKVHKVPMFMVLVCLWVLAKPAQRSLRMCLSDSCCCPQASCFWSTRKHLYCRPLLERRDLKLVAFGMMRNEQH